MKNLGLRKKKLLKTTQQEVNPKRKYRYVFKKSIHIYKYKNIFKKGKKDSDLFWRAGDSVE